MWQAQISKKLKIFVFSLCFIRTLTALFFFHIYPFNGTSNRITLIHKILYFCYDLFSFVGH